ncbi:MAG: hypothetical protein N2644_06950 [Candidatus Sumerlaea chitinivorans]|nr:hypothetical protein [Candidatus Sumerlaea chitinivorans]
MGYRHTPFFNLVDALAYKGCPICILVGRAVRRYLQASLYEFVNDPGLQEALLRSGGLCVRHADLLRSFGDGLGAVLLHKTLAQSLADQRVSRRHGSRNAECPACIQAKEALECYGSTFADHLDEPELQDYLRAEPRLCARCWLWVVERAKTRSVRAQLQACLRAAAERQLRNIERYVEAANATVSAGHENLDDSWKRCLAFFSPLDELDAERGAPL